MSRRSILLGGAFGLLPVLLSSQIPYQTGWPVEITEHYSSPLFIVDIDDDGMKDVIFAGLPNNYQPSRLYAINEDGSILAGFPRNGDIVFTGIPALYDVNDDGLIEIIWAEKDLHMYDSTGNEVWSVPYNGPIFQSTYYPYHVSVDDLDNDGIEEIVVTCYAGGAVFVFEPDGTVRPGWPVTGLGGMLASASIGDIDNDGMQDIVVPSDKIYCFKPDGTSCIGFPIRVSGGSRTKPILLDFNGDGYLEILYAENGSPFDIYAIDHNGNIMPSYPVDQNMFAASVGDINGDGNYEIVVAWWDIFAYDLITTALLPGFPFSDPSGVWSFGAPAPNLCDLSNDPGEEIASGVGNSAWVSDGKLFAFNLQGQVLPGFPSDLLYHRALSTGCTVNDLDGDGDIEICCGSENEENTAITHSTVYCWDVPYPYNLDNVDWAMDGFDLGHTGRWRKLYHIDKINSSLAVEGCTTSPCTLPADGSLHVVTVTATREADGTHPSGQDVRFSRTPGCADYAGPVTDNGDGTYTRTLQAPTTGCTTDIHAWVNEFKLNDSVTIDFLDCGANLGDVNLTTTITALDASLILQAVVGLIPVDDMLRCLGDVTANGAITSLDAAYILMCTVGNCPGLPNTEFQDSRSAHGHCL